MLQPGRRPADSGLTVHTGSPGRLTVPRSDPCRVSVSIARSERGTADRIDEALSVGHPEPTTCRMFNDTFSDRVQTTTSLTVSGPTVVRKDLSEHLSRPRNDGKV